MEYNYDYINLHYGLLKSLLIPVSRNVLDISYTASNRQVKIQIILLDGSFLSDNIKELITYNLPRYDIEIEVRYLTKERFNENKGEWQPKYYNWLDNVLYSKAEVL